MREGSFLPTGVSKEPVELSRRGDEIEREVKKA
jgi:hypothetical protein